MNLLEYHTLFASYGIVTVESFNHYIHNVNELIDIIGKKNKNDAEFMFKSK